MEVVPFGTAVIMQSMISHYKNLTLPRLTSAEDGAVERPRRRPVVTALDGKRVGVIIGTQAGDLG